MYSLRLLDGAAAPLRDSASYSGRLTSRPYRRGFLLGILRFAILPYLFYCTVRVSQARAACALMTRFLPFSFATFNAFSAAFIQVFMSCP